MDERAKKPRPPASARDAALFDETAFDGEAFELRSLLAGWRVGEAPASLRSRVVGSYRQHFTRQKEETMKNYGMRGDGLVAGYALAGAARGEFRLTILEHEGLLDRLAAEVSGVARDSRLTREEFKRDPLGFAGRTFAAYARMTGRALARENVGYGVATAFAVVLTVVGFAVAGDLYGGRHNLLASKVREDLTFIGMAGDIIPRAQPTPDTTGAGMADAGRGGGQKIKLERPGGGGGGGRLEDKPASTGKLPQASLDPQVLAPDPHPPVIQQPSLPTATTIRADPVLFPPDARDLPYGDPKSKASESSSGSGTGNGIGESTGGGVGKGKGAGYGAGEDFNTGGNRGKLGGGGPGNGGGAAYDYGRVHKMSEVTRRAQILERPEPLYTEEARRNQITGTVTLRFVLGADGTVSNIVALSRLPDGLTERAVEAARRIKFSPAEKDGRRVSQYATINYNFNIY